MGFISKLKSFFVSNKTFEIDTGFSLVNPKTVSPSSLTVQELLKKHKNWVYACVTKNAKSVAAVPLRLYAITNSSQAKPKVQHRPLKNFELERLSQTTKLKVNPLLDSTLTIDEIYVHPFLDLLQQENRQQTIELVVTFLELTGNAFVLIIDDPIFDIPQNLVVIPSQNIKVRKNKQGEVEYYFKTNNLAQPIKLPTEDVIHFKYANPLNELWGLSPLASVFSSEELYEEMQLFELSLNKNSAIPSLIVKYISGSLQKDDRKKLESEWNKALRGINKAGKIKVADENFDIQPIGLSPKDMQYLSGRKWIREEICGAFGVPLSLVTTTDVNLANANAGIKIYEKFTILPKLQLIENELNATIIQRYESGDRLFLAFDINLEDEEFKLKKTTELLSAGIIDRDEARAFYGFN